MIATIREMTEKDRLITPSNYDLFGVVDGVITTENGERVDVELFYETCTEMKASCANLLQQDEKIPSCRRTGESIEILAEYCIKFYFLHEVVAGRSELGLIFPIEQLRENLEALTSDDFADFMLSHEVMNPFESNPIINQKWNAIAKWYRDHFNLRSTGVQF